MRASEPLLSISTVAAPGPLLVLTHSRSSQMMAASPQMWSTSFERFSENFKGFHRRIAQAPFGSPSIVCCERGDLLEF